MAYRPARAHTKIHERIIGLIERGLGTNVIAKKTGCRPIQIAAIRAHWTRGTYRRGPRPGPFLMTERTRQKMIRMFSEGVDNETITRRLRLNPKSTPAFEAHYHMGTYTGLVGSRKLVD